MGKIMALQLSNPNATNENIATTALKYLHAVVDLVTEAAAEGRFEEFGGKENVAGLNQSRGKFALAFAKLTHECYHD